MIGCPITRLYFAYHAGTCKRRGSGLLACV